jgi:AcrR family transcriptional regulator
MPKVSEEHLAARREQIVQAALACFGENGFHATTMADVITASGLSAGAVYRYFRGKDELVEAIAARVVGVGSQALTDLLADEPSPHPVEILRRVLTVLQDLATEGRTDLRRVALKVWAEALRSEQVMTVAHQAQVTMRAGFEESLRRSRNAGHLPATADPALVAQALHSLLLGYVIQHLLVGDVDVEPYLTGVEALFSTAPPDPTGSRGAVGA